MRPVIRTVAQQRLIALAIVCRRIRDDWHSRVIHCDWTTRNDFLVLAVKDVQRINDCIAGCAPSDLPLMIETNLGPEFLAAWRNRLADEQHAAADAQPIESQGEGERRNSTPIDKGTPTT